MISNRSWVIKKFLNLCFRRFDRGSGDSRATTMQEFRMVHEGNWWVYNFTNLLIFFEKIRLKLSQCNSIKYRLTWIINVRRLLIKHEILIFTILSYSLDDSCRHLADKIENTLALIMLTKKGKRITETKWKHSYIWLQKGKELIFAFYVLMYKSGKSFYVICRHRI